MAACYERTRMGKTAKRPIIALSTGSEIVTEFWAKKIVQNKRKRANLCNLFIFILYRGQTTDRQVHYCNI